MSTNAFANSILLDDTQLWYLSDGQRSFPLLVTLAEYPAGSGHHRHIVEPAIPPRPVEVSFLRKYLDQHRAGPEEPNLWIVGETCPELILHKAPGITPSWYYRGWENPPQIEEVKPESSMTQAELVDVEEDKKTDAEAFLEYFHTTTNMLPLKDLKVMWHYLSQAIYYWLHKRQRVLDFGCVKLVALPYRKDWAALLWAANPKIRTLFNRPGYEKQALLLQSDWYEHLQHPMIAAVNRHNNTCCWTIHAVETDSWMDSVSNTESHVKAQTGNAWYGQTWIKTIREHEKLIFDTFEAYLDQTNLPHGRVAQVSNGIAPMLIPDRADRPGHSSHPVLNLADGYSFDVDNALLKDLDAENAKLQALPVIQFKTKDLRDTRKDLPAPTPPTTGTGGVLVLDASSGEISI